jgi:hypothetical protein
MENNNSYFIKIIDGSKQECLECGRKFNLKIEEECALWWYGHDCEAVN